VSKNQLRENLITPKSTFHKADLSGWSFTRSDLHASNFVDCDLTGASFNGADLRFAKFINCNLRYASFIGACLLGAVSNNCNTEGANWNHCDMDMIFPQGLINFSPGDFTTFWTIAVMNQNDKEPTMN